MYTGVCVYVCVWLNYYAILKQNFVYDGVVSQSQKIRQTQNLTSFVFLHSEHFSGWAIESSDQNKMCMAADCQGLIWVSLGNTHLSMKIQPLLSVICKEDLA